MRKQESLIQGTDDWNQFRAEHFGASEAVAMLGKSKYESRTELLHRKKTGIVKEVSSFTQKIFDNGHRTEGLARILVEEIIGDTLYPVTYSFGNLSASCDGLTGMNDTAWEHKQWNEKLGESIRRGVLPEEYWPQVQQVMFVTGANELYFTVSDGTKDNFEMMKVYYDEAWFLDVVKSGWGQFAKDLAEYVPVEVIEAPKAEAIMQLPALSIRVDGAISLTDNLTVFGEKLKSFIDGIDKAPKDDQGFANIEAAVKVLDNAEKALKQAEGAALAQVESVDEMRVTVAFYVDLARTTRLMLDKLVKTQKEAIKTGIMNEAVKAYAEHKSGLEEEITPIRLVVAAVNFAEAMRNKRTLASLNDSVNTALANGKVEADAVAKDIRAKLAWYKETMNGFEFLFNDLQDLIYKPIEDFRNACIIRHDKQIQAEADKLEEQRKRIQEEEEAKAKAKQEEELEAERAVIREEERQKALADEISKQAQEINPVSPMIAPWIEPIKADDIKVTAQNIDDAISQSRKWMDDKKNPPVAQIKTTAPRPDELAQVIADHYKVSKATAIDWIVSTYNEITEAA